LADWPYNTPTWRRLRKAKLAQRPFCEPCRARGRIVEANTVDHSKAVAAGGDPFPPLSGLMSMCHACHNTKTNAVDRAGGKGVRFKGCDADGFPIDPQHPAYGGKGDTKGYTPCKDKGLGSVDRCGSRVSTKFSRRKFEGLA
jgi:hypothetical protein